MTIKRIAIASTLLLTLAPLAAFAHVFPKTQQPGAGATVAAPSKVTITFDGPLEPAFSSLTVTDAAGKQVNTAKSVVDTQQPAVESVALPALPAGKYTVHWVSVASDGHRTHGDYSFSVK
jgi:copper resistance protein C